MGMGSKTEQLRKGVNLKKIDFLAEMSAKLGAPPPSPFKTPIGRLFLPFLKYIPLEPEC